MVSQQQDPMLFSKKPEVASSALGLGQLRLITTMREQLNAS
jgi:hypothetical protein